MPRITALTAQSTPIPPFALISQESGRFFESRDFAICIGGLSSTVQLVFFVLYKITRIWNHELRGLKILSEDFETRERTLGLVWPVELHEPDVMLG